MELLYNARKYQLHPPKGFWNELSLIRRILGHLWEDLKSQRKNRQKIFLNEQISPARMVTLAGEDGLVDGGDEPVFGDGSLSWGVKGGYLGL